MSDSQSWKLSLSKYTVNTLLEAFETENIFAKIATNGGYATNRGLCHY